MTERKTMKTASTKRTLCGLDQADSVRTSKDQSPSAHSVVVLRVFRAVRAVVDAPLGPKVRDTFACW